MNTNDEENDTATKSSKKTVPAKTKTSYTRKEIFEMSNPETLCLIIIKDSVYDCTQWQNHHPGGHLTIRALCGKDATDAFASMHPTETESRLKAFYYGELSDSDLSDVTKEFRCLTEDMRQAGFFEVDYSFYYKKIAVYACLFAVVLAGVFLSDKFSVHVLSGALLGVFWQQMAFIGHDLGHNSVAPDHVTNSYLGLIIGNFCTGIGIGWWKRGHNVHHIVTNSIEHDPDIQHLPIFAITPKFLESRVFSSWFNAHLHLCAAAHVLVKYQHILYYPVMAFARFNLYMQSLTHAMGVGMYDKREYMWKKPLQLWSLVGFHAWVFALTAQLPTWSSRLAFYIVAQNVAGILHVQITLSHFSMPAYNGVTYDTCKNGWLMTQLQGSLDIDCPAWMDWVHGGLQFQTVHHLWPRIPRRNLRKAQKLLIIFCQKHGLVYNHLPFLKANYTVFSTLRETAKSTRSLSELFYDGFNLVG